MYDACVLISNDMHYLITCADLGHVTRIFVVIRAPLSYSERARQSLANQKDKIDQK